MTALLRAENLVKHFPIRQHMFGRQTAVVHAVELRGHENPPERTEVGPEVGVGEGGEVQRREREQAADGALDAEQLGRHEHEHAALVVPRLVVSRGGERGFHECHLHDSRHGVSRRYHAPDE